MIVLGLESSCDETSAAVVTSEREVKSNVLLSQIKTHTSYGGVVPELAARSHLEAMDIVIREALEKAQISFKDLTAIAVTGGPGLIGGIMVGVMTAKAIALAHQLPFLAINHLAAHALTVRLSDNVNFPFLLLLVSGGHCQILIVHSSLRFQLLGSTIDDAVGECFDKVGKLLGVSYPAGPRIEKLAEKGNPERFLFPKPLLNKKEKEHRFSFSFSGLKTAVRREIQGFASMTGQTSHDLCASFQKTIGDILENRCRHALQFCKDSSMPVSAFVMAGGVAANHYLRNRLKTTSKQFGINLVAPPIHLCTDNAAMVAWAGIEKHQMGQQDTLDFAPRPRWPLEELNLS